MTLLSSNVGRVTPDSDLGEQMDNDSFGWTPQATFNYATNVGLVNITESGAIATMDEFDQLVLADIPTVEGTVYEVTDVKTIVRHVRVVNTTAGAITVTIKLGEKEWLSSYSIPANDFEDWGGMEVLLTGDFIKASASDTGLRLFVSGVEEVLV